MKHYVRGFSRFFIGVLFIFSGLIKLNDPIGTAIKMREYFEVFATDFGAFFHVFIPWATEVAMLLIVLEIVLGVAVLIYYRMKTTTYLLLVLVVFFAFLTFYSAYFNKVTDCGCFGDAIKLTPWQSFYKDIVLMVFVIVLFWYRKNHVPFLSSLSGHMVILGTLIISFFMGIYAMRHLPFIDFRAYRVGNNISQQMVPAEQPVIEYRFTKQGKEITSTQFLSQEEGYRYISSTIVNADKIIPNISDYNVVDREGNDVTSETFRGVKLLVIVSDAKTASETNTTHLRTLILQLQGKVQALILTSSQEEEIEIFRHENQLPIPYFYVDATVLKTIVRSNPGLTLWKEGNVLGKWHYNDFPTPEDVLALL